MIDPTKTTPEKLAEMNDSLIIDNNYLRTELVKVRQELAEAVALKNEKTSSQP